MGPVMLFCVPGAMPVTLTENTQDPFAASVPPERLMLLLPALAVIVPEQVVVKPWAWIPPPRRKGISQRNTR